jgi:hypothetical protein
MCQIPQRLVIFGHIISDSTILRISGYFEEMIIDQEDVVHLHSSQELYHSGKDL